jgi:hypothetical protein
MAYSSPALAKPDEQRSGVEKVAATLSAYAWLGEFQMCMALYETDADKAWAKWVYTLEVEELAKKYDANQAAHDNLTEVN